VKVAAGPSASRQSRGGLGGGGGRRVGGQSRLCSEDDKAAVLWDAKIWPRLRGAELWPAWARLSPTWLDLGHGRGAYALSRSRRPPARSRRPPGHDTAAHGPIWPDWARLGSCWPRSWRACSWCSWRGWGSFWRVTAAWVAGLLVGGARVHAGHVLTLSVFRRVGGSRRSCFGAMVYLPCFGGTISVLSWRVVVLLRRWLTCSSPSISCLLRWCLVTACLCFARVRFPARVKALLGDAGADHGDTCGCHFLLGGVFLGRAAPPLHTRGNPRSALSDRPAATLRRRFPS
jgi:hypothetical protein